MLNKHTETWSFAKLLVTKKPDEDHIVTNSHSNLETQNGYIGNCTADDRKTTAENKAFY